MIPQIWGTIIVVWTTITILVLKVFDIVEKGDALRAKLADTYRELARLTDEPEIRAGWVDLANSLRPWSLL